MSMIAPDIDFDSQIEAAGTELAAHLAAGTYECGHEARQARELIAALNDDDRHELLIFLLYNRFERMVTVDCLLDETDERSYVLVESLAEQMLAEIAGQNRNDAALYELTVSAIDGRAHLIQTTDSPEGVN